METESRSGPTAFSIGKHGTRQKRSDQDSREEPPWPPLVVTTRSPPSPGHCRGPRPELRRLLPTAPPRGLWPKPASPVQSAASGNRPFRVAFCPRDKDVAGNGQVPLSRTQLDHPIQKRAGQAKRRRPQFALSACNEKYTWKVQATAHHPHLKLRAGQPVR